MHIVFSCSPKLYFMKKMIWLSLASLIALPSLAQRAFKPGIGVNITDFASTEGGKAVGKTGWQIGATFASGKKFYFEPGIFYVEKSTEFTTTVGTPDEFKANISGIRVPIGIGLNVLGTDASTVTLHVMGGGSAFFITGTNDEIDKDQLNTTNWGAYLGAGVDFWKLFLDISYEWEFSDLQKDAAQVNIGQSRTWFITVGLKLNKASK